MDSNLPVMAARMRLKTVALIIPDITNPFFGEMARAIGTRMNEKGYSLLLGDSLFSTEMEGKWIRDFVSKKVDGIIIAPVGLSLIHIFRKCGIILEFLLPTRWVWRPLIMISGKRF